MSYSISSSLSKDEEEVKRVAKEATEYLFGGANNINEFSEDYYLRRKKWNSLRYNPEIPKDPNILIYMMKIVKNIRMI